MIAQYLESKGISGRGGKTQVLALAAMLLTGVMGLEWFQNLDYSLGVFYILPVALAATVLNWWETLLVAVFCACARSLFTGGLSTIEFSLRFIMALLAYGGVGGLVSMMSNNRRTVLEAYARLKMEEHLRQRAEDQLRMLVDSSPAGIMTLNHRGKVLAANRAAHEMLGFDQPGSLVGFSIGDHVPVFSGALRVAPGRGPMRVSSASWATRANGSHFPVAVWFSTYDDAGERRLAGILVDTSEEVRERERETFRYLTDSNRLLAGAVAHEIRNLCSAIRMVTNNLRRHTEVTTDADFGALNTLVESLMRISAFELTKGKSQLAVRVDLASVLEELRLVIEPDWLEIGGAIRWDIPAQLPPVHVDEHALLQVFLNLAQNSWRAVQRGGSTILDIRVETRNETTQIAFEDRGPGIDDTSKLFKPFRENSDGSGLGLYVSRAMLRGFGGELIHVPTQQGCRFDITLPAYHA